MCCQTILNFVLAKVRNCMLPPWKGLIQQGLSFDIFFITACSRLATGRNEIFGVASVWEALSFGVPHFSNCISYILPLP